MKLLFPLAVAACLAACATAPVAPEFDDPSDGASSFSRAVVTGELVFLADGKIEIECIAAR